MNENEFTPEQSLQLISKVINEAKLKFEENGVIYMMWGLLVSVAAISQYLLLTNSYENISFYPWFLTPLGSIFTAIYYSRKRRNKVGKRSHLSFVIMTVWIGVGVNILILGFAFVSTLGKVLIPLILILTSIGIVVSGVILKSRLLIWSGIIMNILAIGCFFIPYISQLLLLGFANLVCVFLPGFLMMKKHNSKNV